MCVINVTFLIFIVSPCRMRAVARIYLNMWPVGRNGIRVLDAGAACTFVCWCRGTHPGGPIDVVSRAFLPGGPVWSEDPGAGGSSAD